MGKRTIAESVEDESMLVRLREMGIDYMQGYAISRPRPFQPMDQDSRLARPRLHSTAAAGAVDSLG